MILSTSELLALCLSLGWVAGLCMAGLIYEWVLLPREGRDE